ncbi:putative F-box protein At3g17480 [Daucus carota subsp. sativus]|uniref:putative F-box protein At3g17480 n=1 Tax=Daucus carota subsp. sativus TaxID=79200 RepID=UPI0007EF1893|nr:PREDICTED: putative F-box protein At3g17480 [Daucus carota subsp. sativus]
MAATSGKAKTPYERRSKISQIVCNQAAAAESSDHQKRMRERKNATTLPEDLILAEILPRIPAKYILRCRLVCKSWNSVFSTPAFVNSHLTHQLHNSEENDRIIIKRYGFNEQVDILSLTNSIRVPKVPCACDKLCGSINGLVLIVSTPRRRFCLWNPAIGQVRLFDFPPLDVHYAGFCWDHVQNDYKVLMFCHAISRQIFIYSTNSATWTSLPGFMLWMSPGPSTIVKGTPYWSYPISLTLPGEKLKRKFFSTFKFVPEINEFRILPDLDSLKCRGNNFNIANIRDRLVGMAYKLVNRGESNTMVDMYSLDDEESSSGVWSKMYSIGPVCLDSTQWLSQAFRNGGEILIRGDSGPCAFYDPKTKEIKSIAGTTSTFLREFGGRCYSYMPSLVRVRGMESMQNFSTNGVS